MRLQVALHGFGERQRETEVPEGATYLDLLRALGIPIESALVTAGGTVVPADATIDPAKPVRLVRIVSGG
jgi:sulfur carrier protein ThiS